MNNLIYCFVNQSTKGLVNMIVDRVLAQFVSEKEREKVKAEDPLRMFVFPRVPKYTKHPHPHSPLAFITNGI